MQIKKSLSLQIAGAVALATMVGTSAFAETRHHERTAGQSGGRIGRTQSSQPRVAPQHFEQRNNADRTDRSSNINRSNRSNDGNRSSSDRGAWRGNDTQRRDNVDRSSVDRNNVDRNRNTPRYESRNNSGNRNDGYRNNNNSRQQADRYRNNNRGSWRPDSRVAPYRGQNYSGHGRVSRYERYRDGYRVWIGGGLYPIFVPFSHWRLHPLRVGININFGGYWDPLGYWNVYDYSPYDGYYGRTSDVYTRGDIRGIVESVDDRRGTLVLNDDISRQFVTVTMPRDRRMDDVRPGDFVEFSGDWRSSGVFNAYRLERIEDGRDNRY